MPKDLACDLLRFFRRFGKLYAAAFAAAAGMDLGFDDNDIRAEFARRRFRFFRRTGNDAARTGTPYSFRMALPWYSWIFIKLTGEQAARLHWPLAA